MHLRLCLPALADLLGWAICSVFLTLNALAAEDP
jgi:hypothetical protein